jgi:hypothetical protein
MGNSIFWRILKKSSSFAFKTKERYKLILENSVSKEIDPRVRYPRWKKKCLRQNEKNKYIFAIQITIVKGVCQYNKKTKNLIESNFIENNFCPVERGQIEIRLSELSGIVLI